MNFQQKLKKWQNLIDQELYQALPSSNDKPSQLHQAMNYSMNAGGKRLRPIMVLAAHEIFPSARNPIPAALAIECIHTYSLIHDDLPAMDNSNLRRGKPTCHKEFDEATAILAGDAFQPLAFEILSTAYENDSKLAVCLISILARTAGSRKLVGGQMQDLISEGLPPDQENLSYIHSNKTAAMIQASLQMGFSLGALGKDSERLAKIAQLGHSIGLAFQAVDDLLDVSQSTAKLGKDAHHDSKSGKVTWISLRGEQEARILASNYTRDAKRILDSIGGDSRFLSDLIDFMLLREF